MLKACPRARACCPTCRTSGAHRRPSGSGRASRAPIRNAAEPRSPPTSLSKGTTMSYLPGKFIWFELATADVAKARAFYEPLFGWHVESMPMGDQSYHMIHNGDQGIGGFAAPEGGASRWISYISVPDVDKSYQAALAAGAKGGLQPTDFPPVGRCASMLDPTGAAVSLW